MVEVKRCVTAWLDNDGTSTPGRHATTWDTESYLFLNTVS